MLQRTVRCAVVATIRGAEPSVEREEGLLTARNRILLGYALFLRPLFEKAGWVKPLPAGVVTWRDRSFVRNSATIALAIRSTSIGTAGQNHRNLQRESRSTLIHQREAAMIIVCVAHAEASRKVPRTLTDKGRADTKAALQRAYNLVKHLQSGVPLRSMRLISSPACRCLETILMAGDEFGRDFADLDRSPPGMDRAEVLEQLLAGHEVDLLGITQDLAADLVVIALHGDLAKVPPLSERQLATIDSSGFFDAHPVVAVLQRNENDLKLTRIEGLFEGRWQNLEVIE